MKKSTKFHEKWNGFVTACRQFLNDYDVLPFEELRINLNGNATKTNNLCIQDLTTFVHVVRWPLCGANSKNFSVISMEDCIGKTGSLADEDFRMEPECDIKNCTRLFLCVGQVANLVPGFQIDFDVIQFVISIVLRSDHLKEKFMIVPVQILTESLEQPKNWTWKDAFEHIDQLVFCTGEKKQGQKHDQKTFTPGQNTSAHRSSCQQR